MPIGQQPLSLPKMSQSPSNGSVAWRMKPQKPAGADVSQKWPTPKHVNRSKERDGFRRSVSAGLEYLVQRCIRKFIRSDDGIMFAFRSVMIHVEPATTMNTISRPNANASTLSVLSGPVVMCQEKHQMDTHLRDSENHRRRYPGHASRSALLYRFRVRRRGSHPRLKRGTFRPRRAPWPVAHPAAPSPRSA